MASALSLGALVLQYEKPYYLRPTWERLQEEGKGSGGEGRGGDRRGWEWRKGAPKEATPIPAVGNHMRDTKSELPTKPTDSQNHERY